MPESSKRGGLGGIVSRILRGLEGEPKPEAPRLRVTTHVARDLLQNAAYFNSVPKAVAEYVTNAIDNAAPGRPVRCEVTLSREEVRIADDASGMTRAELFNFFQMHGENVQRRRGRSVRGKFGTGKSAAFGIASTLLIETAKGGQSNVVELRRADVEAAKDGQPIPVREVVVNRLTRERSGTTILIRDLNTKNVDASAVRVYLEKLLGRHLRLHKVIVNGAACQYHEPESIKTFKFKAPREVAEHVGAALCVLKMSREPLARDDNAVAVLSGGFLHATTLAGKQAEPFVEYIFGEVEAPALDSDSDPIPAFDNTRNLTLNAQNPRVQALLGWLADCIEEVRQELIARDKRRRYSKEMRLLRKVAAEIQGFLEEDFRVVQDTLPWATMRGSRRRRKSKGQAASPQKTGSSAQPAPRSPTLLERGRAFVNRLLGRRDPLPDTARAAAAAKRGGRVQFEINYVRLGPAGPRSRYITNRRLIYLNRDHPQIRAAEREAGVESLTFKMLSFDIAFTEYALAVVSQLADQGIEVADPIDASEMVQEILDRLGRRAADYFDTLLGAQIEAEEGQAEEEISAAA